MGSAALREAITAIRDWSMTANAPAEAPSHATEVYGSLAFNDAVQRARLPKQVYKALRRTIERRRAAGRLGGRHRRDGDEGLGGRARRHALHALVPADDRHHGREARLLPLAHGRRQGHRRVQRQGADQGRARRLELPVRRHAHHLRGARLHRVGPDQPALAAQAASTAARWSSRARSCRWTGEALDKKTPLLRSHRGAVHPGRPHPEAVRVEGRARLHDQRPRAGVLPDRRARSTCRAPT